MMSSYYSRGYSTSEKTPIALFVIFVIILIIVCCYRPINKASDIRDVTVTVTDKTVKNSSDDSKYLVFTEDANGNIQVFEITDSLFYGRWNSSDVYAAIKVGYTYKFTVGGSRSEFWSWYPNIYEYEIIEDNSN